MREGVSYCVELGGSDWGVFTGRRTVDTTDSVLYPVDTLSRREEDCQYYSVEII